MKLLDEVKLYLSISYHLHIEPCLLFYHRPETEEEKMLKEEINVLRKELEEGLHLNTNKESVQESAGEMQNLRDRINKKERELETLILDLDDKVRFGKKATERPGSGAGKAAAFQERPPSQGSFDESRSFESMDRPRSRGTTDVWSRSADDRKPIQGARDGGFLGNRNIERFGFVCHFVPFCLFCLFQIYHFESQIFHFCSYSRSRDRW